MIKRIKRVLREKWCDLAHRADQVKLPLYKQGTYEQIGIAIYCKRCIKGG